MLDKNIVKMFAFLEVSGWAWILQANEHKFYGETAKDRIDSYQIKFFDKEQEDATIEQDSYVCLDVIKGDGWHGLPIAAPDLPSLAEWFHCLYGEDDLK